MGTRFIATKESMASNEYKTMMLGAKTGPPPTFLPTVYTDQISGFFFFIFFEKKVSKQRFSDFKINELF
mgnify:CR=1 FL=1